MFTEKQVSGSKPRSFFASTWNITRWSWWIRHVITDNLMLNTPTLITCKKGVWCIGEAKHRSVPTKHWNCSRWRCSSMQKHFGFRKTWKDLTFRTGPIWLWNREDVTYNAPFSSSLSVAQNQVSPLCGNEQNIFFLMGTLESKRQALLFLCLGHNVPKKCAPMFLGIVWKKLVSGISPERSFLEKLHTSMYPLVWLKVLEKPFLQWLCRWKVYLWDSLFNFATEFLAL